MKTCLVESVVYRLPLTLCAPCRRFIHEYRALLKKEKEQGHASPAVGVAKEGDATQAVRPTDERTD
jgi:hypothetical protein